MRRSKPAYPAVSDEGRTQSDDKLSDVDVKRVLTSGRSGMRASGPREKARMPPSRLRV